MAGLLIVLVDEPSRGPRSEEFAALLQDNRAAFVMGEPTGGAGCGHTDGVATDSAFQQRRQVFELPDCVRLRRDGSNEVRGVIPDLTLGWAIATTRPG